jgi:D-alanyl-D-alanine carboxypeptidase-like protein
LVSSKEPSHPERGIGSAKRFRWRARGAVAVVVSVLLLVPAAAIADHMRRWRHDHSSAGVPYRPDGYNDLVRVFGQPCSGRGNDARTWFPHASGRYQPGYVNHHPYIARNVAYNILGHVDAAHSTGAWDYGQYGYVCKQRTGGSGPSTHSFGAAIDTNTAKNPYGQCSWNGVGANGVAYGTFLPNIWRDTDVGHHFRWGKDWCDPHHFQYATGW